MRAIDRGWPFDDVQETLAGARSPTAALATWLAEPTDRGALLEPRFGAAVTVAYGLATGFEERHPRRGLLARSASRASAISGWRSCRAHAGACWSRAAA